jgi:glutamine transport system permease protein
MPQYVQDRLNIYDAILLAQGLGNTVLLCVSGLGLGLVIALFVGLARASRSRCLSWPAAMYIEIIRDSPLLMQLYLIFFALPLMGLQVPILVAGVATLMVNSSAFMAEIVRAGIQAIEPGQMDAAKSLGMTNLQAMRRVILPQALRVVIPPTGNEVIAMLKNTSVAFVIAFVELTTAARLIYAVNFKVMELLVVASIWYLIMTTAFSVLQAEVEARMAIVERDRVLPLSTRVLRTLGGSRER